MGFCGFARVMGRMKRMGMSAVSMMSCGLMVTGGMVPGGFFMMLRGLLVMLSCLRMMLVGGVLCHALSPLMHT
jgi:hypothetical protein